MNRVDAIFTHARAAALALVALLLPWETLAGGLALGPLTVTGLELALLASAAVEVASWPLALPRAGAAWRAATLAQRTVAVGGLLLAASAIVSAVFAPPLPGTDAALVAIKASARLLVDALLGLAAWRWFARPPAWLPVPRLLGLLVGSGTLAAGLGVVEQQVADGVWVEPLLQRFRPKATLWGPVRRLTGPFLQANITAGFFAALLPLSWAFWRHLSARARAGATPARTLVAGLAAAAVATQLWALLGTYSRGGVVAAAAAAAVWWLCAGRRAGRLGVSGLGVALLVLCGLRVGVDPALRHRVGLSPHGPAVQYVLEQPRAGAAVRAAAGSGGAVDRVRLRNTGWLRWRAAGTDPMRVEALRIDPDGAVLAVARRRLPRAVAPGEAVNVSVLRPPSPVPSPVGAAAPVASRVVWRLAQHGWRRFEPRASPGSEAAPQPRPPSASGGTPRGRPAAGRAALWPLAWRRWLARPLLGWGADTFRLRWPADRPDLRPDRRMHANSLWLEVLVDLGVFGALGLLLVVLGAAANGLRQGGVAGAAAAGVVVAALHGVVDCLLFFHVTAALFWLSVGLAAAPRSSLRAGERD